MIQSTVFSQSDISAHGVSGSGASATSIASSTFNKFQKELLNIMQDYSDATKPLIIDGHRFSAEQKYGIGASALLSNKVQTGETIMQQILDQLKNSFSLDSAAAKLMER